jgi:NADH:ubiquinone reductase (H+-translocating)
LSQEGSNLDNAKQPRLANIVICGGGYAGIQAALELERLLKGTNAIMLIDKGEHHILLPSLPEAIMKRGFYQIPYKDIFGKKKVRFVQSTISTIDLDGKRVMTVDGQIGYDILVIALGGKPHLPDIPGLESAYKFNDIEDVQKIIKRLSAADNEAIVVAGGGATGVEVAGEIASYIEATKKELKIILVSPSLLAGFPDSARSWAKSYLQSLDIELRIGNEFAVSKVENGSSILLRGGGKIKSDFIIWTGGTKAHSFPKDMGLTTGDRERVIVNQFLQSVDRQNVFVIGDCALILDEQGKQMPTSAQFAEQQGRLAARNIHAILVGQSMKKYTPSLEGFAISIGPYFAVARLGTLDLYGRIASSTKKLIKLKYLKEIAGVSAAAKDYASSES